MGVVGVVRAVRGRGGDDVEGGGGGEGQRPEGGGGGGGWGTHWKPLKDL